MRVDNNFNRFCVSVKFVSMGVNCLSVPDIVMYGLCVFPARSKRDHCFQRAVVLIIAYEPSIEELTTTEESSLLEKIKAGSFQFVL